VRGDFICFSWPASFETRAVLILSVSKDERLALLRMRTPKREPLLTMAGLDPAIQPCFT
jgi:hypothetical protein